MQKNVLNKFFLHCVMSLSYVVKLFSQCIISFAASKGEKIMSDFRCSVIFSVIVTSTCGTERRGRKKGKFRPRTGEEGPEGE